MMRATFRGTAATVAGLLSLSALLQAQAAAPRAVAAKPAPAPAVAPVTPVTPSQSPVADAAMQRDLATVKSLLKTGADVNAAQGDGMSALHWAAMSGDTELASVLLYAGGNHRATTRLGDYTPLHLAAKGGSLPVLKALLDSGADANAKTATGATALMLASTSGQVEAVQALLDKGADPNAKESTYGQTALMFAAALDRAPVVKALLARGADPKIASKFEDLAALTLGPGGTGRDEVDPVTMTVRRAPQPPANGPKDMPGVSRPYRYNELIGGQGGLTPLHFAARQGHMATVQALVEGGADVNQASPGDRTTPLIIATINGHFDLAKFLLDHGADANQANDAGVTALYGAINVQWAPIAAYPQPRAYLQQKQTYLEFMQALLDKGADPNRRLNRKVWFASYNFDQSSIDETGATPFWRAAYAADVDAMKLLVKYGADPTIPTMKPAGRMRGDDGQEVEDKSGMPPVAVGGPSMTALHAAAGPGYGLGFAANSHHYAPGGMMPAVKYLVDELHLDVNAVDAEGNSVVHNAASRGDNEMIEFLVSKGADVTKVNRRGQTTVDMANGPVQRTQPYPETIKLLEKLGARNNHKCLSC